MKPCNCTSPSTCHSPQDHGGLPKRKPKPVPPRTPGEEWAYHSGMAVFMAERGYHELARSHAIAAEDWLTTIQGRAA